MLKTLNKEWSAKIATVFFVFMTIWWLTIFLPGSKETFQNYLFAATYGLICLWGGSWGLIISKKWGGFSSAIGRAIIFFSLGLLAQEFGQLVFSYYNIFLKIEIPYPSLADVGFFGSIPFYIFGMAYLAKAAGSKFSLNTITNKLQIVVVPVSMLMISYLLFLKGYEFDFSDPLKVFLDFGYPFGEAFYISVAILAYFLSRKLLGGVMKSRILLLIGAFVMQYLADFNFLYQNSQGTWVNGGYGDYIYFLAYFVMTLGLIQFRTVLDKLN
ncbi:hypothetical protein HYU93_00640 [Candidatus Daviesbacteria bacterium]|nr:hypothetical protein [Candidatus Daviesbacteria bacterium]